MKKQDMTIKKIIKYILILIVGTFYPVYGFSGEAYRVDITNPFFKKAPIAIPEFLAVSGSAKERQIADGITNKLSEMLMFTGYFKLVNPDAFLEEPKVNGIDEARINFRNWTVIGADLLVTGSVLEDDGKIVVELHLFDTFREIEFVKKDYIGKEKSVRKIARKFGTEIVKKFTGNSGIFHSKIAFISTGTGNKEVYICAFDGYAPGRVTNTKNITLSPAWSSNGKYLAYTSYENGKPDIFVKNLKNAKVSVLSSKKGTNITPAWLPGKDLLGASLSYKGDQGIYLLTRTGKIRKRLTRKWSKWGIDVSPSFSPDGKKMVFVSRRAGTPQLFIKDLSSGHVRRLTYQGKYNTSPSWSPAGDKIAYSSSVDGRFEIFVIGNDGQNPVQLTRDSGDNESPAWSPDGSLIAFSSTREGFSRIFIMNSYGKDQRRLLFLSGAQTNPKWSSNVFIK